MWIFLSVFQMNMENTPKRIVPFSNLHSIHGSFYYKYICHQEPPLHGNIYVLSY